MFNVNTVTQYRAKKGRKMIAVCVDFEDYQKLLVIAAMKSIKGEKSSVSGIANYAIKEFLENNKEFVKEMFEVARPFGIHMEDDLK